MLFRSKPTAAFLALLSTASLMPGSASAQSLSTRELNARSAAQAAAAVPTTPLPGGGYVTPTAPDPVEALSRYLRVLATSPRNLDALTGAGNAALAIGDANAAVSLFARAEEISPRNGRIKAGLASGLVQLDQPRTAIKLFDDAVSLGVPEAEIAGDRGLAYDLRGDTKRAQADYAQALRWRADDEITRRLAVSQAIGGDKAGALATLDGLFRRQDRAAWRIRAFVLALTGDRTGAEAAAIAVMPQAQAQALIPFFGRLAALQPGQKAAAVHLGQFPADAYAGTAGQSRSASAAPPPERIQAGSPSAAQLVPAGPAFGMAPAAGAYPSGASGMAAGQGGASRFAPPPATVSPSAVAPPLMGRVVPAPPAPSPAAVPPAANPPASAYYPPAPAVAPAPPLANGANTATFAPSASTGGGLPGAAAAGQSASTPLPAPIPVATFPAPAAAMPPQTGVQPAQAAPPPAVAAGFLSDPLAESAAVVGATAGVAPATSQQAPAAGAPPSPVQPGAMVRPLDPPASMPARIPPPSSDTAGRPERRSGPNAADKAEAPQADSPKAGSAKPIRDKAETDRTRKTPDTKADRSSKSDKPRDAEASAGRKGAKGQDPKDAKGKGTTDAREAKAGKDSKDLKDGKSTKRDAKAEKEDKAKSSGGEKYWVQVASGSNRADLGKVWDKTRGKAPKLLGGRTTWTTPWKQSNRLLVGPFKSEEEAQGLVNSLGKAGLGGIPFTTRGNAKVERLGSE
jgi:Flp pilus assembly protein TadD